MLLNILAVGDVVGEGGQDILARRLWELRRQEEIHFTVVNGENASGVGITPKQALGILDAGADVITLGNHTWNRLQITNLIDKDRRILRPANYAGRVPGRGWGVFQGPEGLRIGVVNLMGRVDLNPNLDSPFQMADRVLNQLRDCSVMPRPPAKRARWPGTWTDGSRPCGALTPMCPLRIPRSCPRAPALSPTWA